MLERDIAETCRRFENGGIDYDYYRARARGLRSHARRHWIGRLAGLVRPAIAAAVLLMAFAGLVSVPPENRSCPAQAQGPLTSVER